MAAKEEQKESSEQKKSSKKWIIISGCILLTAIVVGVTVFFLMHGKGEGEEGAEGEETAQEAVAKKPPAIYPLEPLIVNIHDGAELRYLKIKMEFEMKSPEAKAELDPFLAPMQDALLVLLSGKQMQDITTTEGKSKLRSEIMASIGKIVPPEKITGVYFTDFVIQ